MKSFRLTVGIALAVASVAPGVQACGPYFPISYFPTCYDCADAATFDVPRAVATNASWKSFNDYRVTPHLGTELSMIGAHYYPAWTGKSPVGNRVSTAQADEADFFAAGAAASVPEEAVREDWRRFREFCAGVCKRLEAGEKVGLPEGVPDYALEFYLYKLGHANWLVFRKDEDPEPFARLLALPKERRTYRTVWVHFVRIANARNPKDKDRHVDAFRKALDAGFEDTAALESFLLRYLSNTCGNRYDPLVLTSYAQTPWAEWPGFAKRIFCRRRSDVKVSPQWIERLCSDPVGVEVAIAYGAGGKLPPHAVRPENPALGADRQAWIAFDRGDLPLCRKLLAMAPSKSLIRLFLESRLARLDGDYEAAGERLHEWLVEYRRKSSQPGETVTGYRIGAEDTRYWSSGIAGVGEFGGVIHYCGSYGPMDGFAWEFDWGFRECEASQSGEPTLPRVVAGELGVVMVATRDLEEALHSFMNARNWIDIAFVAERAMSVDELVKFMRSCRIDAPYASPLRDLLMRRLMRCGRIREAAEWAPAELKPLCDEFGALHALAVDAQADVDARAVAYFNLSRLTATRGMELMGTELRPDVSVFDGNYAWDGCPLEEPTNLVAHLGAKANDVRWDVWKVPTDRVSGRFHYRRKAVKYARLAAECAQCADVRAWALMYGGVVALSYDDSRTADWFYRKLSRMRHPRAVMDGDWFTSSPAYWWLRAEHYNRERRLKPMRVPPRMTLEQIKSLRKPE